MSSNLANLIENLSPEEQQVVETLILRLRRQRAEPSIVTKSNQGFPFGVGAQNPLVRGTQADQDRLWRAMTSEEADDFLEGSH